MRRNTVVEEVEQGGKEEEKAGRKSKVIIEGERKGEKTRESKYRR